MGDVFDALSRSRGEPVARPVAGDGNGEAETDATAERPLTPEHPGALPLAEVEAKVEREGRVHHAVPPMPIGAPPPRTPPAPPSEAARLVPPPRPMPTPQPNVRITPGIQPPRPNGGADPARQQVLLAQYRQIRDGMIERGKERGVQVHLLTSSTAREGRTATLLRIAGAFAELPDARVVLVEADLHHPSFHRQFQRPFTPGLVQLLRNRATLNEAIHNTRHVGLDVLPAGDCEFNESLQLVSGQAMADLIRTLRDRYDKVLIDGPAVQQAPDDAAVLASLADEVLLVVRMHKTPSELVEDTKSRLRAAHTPLAGVILSHM